MRLLAFLCVGTLMISPNYLPQLSDEVEIIMYADDTVLLAQGIEASFYKAITDWNRLLTIFKKISLATVVFSLKPKSVSFLGRPASINLIELIN